MYQYSICWSHRWFNVSLISSKKSFTILPSESDLKRTYCHSLSHDVIWQSSKVGCSINATHNVWTPSEPKQFSPQAFATKCPWHFSANISPYHTISHPQLWKQQPNLLKVRIFMVERLTLKFIKVSKKAVAHFFFLCVCVFRVKIKGSSRIWPVSGVHPPPKSTRHSSPHDANSWASPAPKSWEIPSKKITFPWGVHVSFISRGLKPIYMEGSKPSFFMVLGRNHLWPFTILREHVTFLGWTRDLDTKVVGDLQWSVIKRSPLTWIFVWLEHLSLSKNHAKKNRSTSTKSQVSQQSVTFFRKNCSLRQVNLAPTKTCKDWSEMLVYTSLSLQTYTAIGDIFSHIQLWHT